MVSPLPRPRGRPDEPAGLPPGPPRDPVGVGVAPAPPAGARVAGGVMALRAPAVPGRTGGVDVTFAATSALCPGPARSRRRLDRSADRLGHRRPRRGRPLGHGPPRGARRPPLSPVGPVPAPGAALAPPAPVVRLGPGPRRRGRRPLPPDRLPFPSGTGLPRTMAGPQRVPSAGETCRGVRPPPSPTFLGTGAGPGGPGAVTASPSLPPSIFRCRLPSCVSAVERGPQARTLGVPATTVR